MAFGFIKKPFQKLKGNSSTSSVDGQSALEDKTNGVANGHANGTVTGNSGVNGNSVGRSRGNTIKKSSKQRQSISQNPASKKIDQAFMNVGTVEGAELYRPLSMNQSKARKAAERFRFKELDLESKLSTFPGQEEVR
jgi:hypothetical protein